MKKSSLLAISVASLVALVGCGKQASASAKDLDKKAAALFTQFYEGSIPEEALTAVFSYQQTLKVSGSSATETYPAGTYNFDGSFHIKYNSTSYEWEVDPQEGEEWTPADIEEMNELVNDYEYGAQMGYTVAHLPYLVYSAIDLDEDRNFVCTYFQDQEETYKALEEKYADVNLKFKFSYGTSPLAWSMGYTQSGDDAEEGEAATYKWKAETSDSYTYDKYGFMTKLVKFQSEEIKGISDRELDGSFSIKETYSIQYLTYSEVIA